MNAHIQWLTGQSSQSSQSSHQKTVRLQMQNAFIARMLKKAAEPEPEPADENEEMHDSALFDVVVEVDFYDGQRLRIPQTSTPEGWICPF
jgi:hypothetical protein